MFPARKSSNVAAGSTKSGDTPVRIMLVDDSLIVRTAFSRMIDAQDDLQVVATAGSAESALMQLREFAVDVILLDLEMPGMGGLEALPKLLAGENHPQVLVVSSLTDDGAEHTLAALSMGAADTMLKPQGGRFDASYREALLDKIRALGRKAERATGKAAAKIVGSRPAKAKRPKVIAIGASTGGIHALNILLRALPASFDLPILITQHLPASFMPVFARQLEVAGARRTVIADDDTPLEKRTIIVAPGHGHMVIRKRPSGLVTSISIDPAPSGCMPSVDPMLSSLAKATEGEALGVILSGMGRDGVIGAEELVNRGGSILAQDRETSAVWGMPRAVIEAGLASAAIAPDKISGKIVERAGVASWT